MQTFLPLPDFAASAASLDRQRLGKQRIENLQLMRAIVDPSAGWRNHPCVGMWRTVPCALFRYHEAICSEWVAAIAIPAGARAETCMTGFASRNGMTPTQTGWGMTPSTPRIGRT